MSSDFEILDQMIKDAAKIGIDPEHKKYKVTLDEPQTKNCCVKISGLPAETMVIKVDAFKSPGSIFKGQKGECKRADFLIIADTGKKKVAIHLEMKKDSGEEKEIINQLRGSCCFLFYCQKVGETFWQAKNFLQGYDHRYVSISHISIAKRKTRAMRSSGVHDRPEKMLKIHYPGYLEFNRLTGS